MLSGESGDRTGTVRTSSTPGRNLSRNLASSLCHAGHNLPGILSPEVGFKSSTQQGATAKIIPVFFCGLTRCLTVFQDVAVSQKPCYYLGMQIAQGRVVEIYLEAPSGEPQDDRAVGETTAVIACPPAVVPESGRYVQAYFPSLPEQPLAATLFSTGDAPGGFRAVSLFPLSWSPGMRVQLMGPLGHGFHLPVQTARLVLAAVSSTISRLLPLAVSVLSQGGEVVLFSDGSLPTLPASIEVYPLSALPDAVSWADFMALDLPLESLKSLRQIFGLPPGRRLPCPAQALILTYMPCSGLADCGACAVPTRDGWLLACKDGPVFDLNAIEWG